MTAGSVCGDCRECRVLGSLTSELENSKDEGKKKKKKNHLPAHTGEPALMHFNEPVLYTAGSVEGFMGVKDEALN